MDYDKFSTVSNYLLVSYFIFTLQTATISMRRESFWSVCGKVGLRGTGGGGVGVDVTGW